MEQQPTPLADQLAGVRAATTSNDDRGWLPASLHALIMACLARIFGRLEHLLLLWQAGNLAPLSPSPAHPPGTTPGHPDLTPRSTARFTARFTVRDAGQHPHMRDRHTPRAILPAETVIRAPNRPARIAPARVVQFPGATSPHPRPRPARDPPLAGRPNASW